MEQCRLKLCLSGVFFVICALISDNGVRTDVNFKSKPTTIKTFENDSVLLPCYSTGSESCKFSMNNFSQFSAKILRRSLCDDEKYFAVMAIVIMRNCFRVGICRNLFEGSRPGFIMCDGKKWTHRRLEKYSRSNKQKKVVRGKK